MTQQLKKLASAAGIEHIYTDIWGNERQASDDTLRDVLKSLGFDTETDASMQRGEDMLLHAGWTEALEPVCCLDVSEQAIAVPVTLQSATLGESLSVRFGAGEKVGGGFEFNPADLEVIETKRIADIEYTRVCLVLPVSATMGYRWLALSHQGREFARTLIVVSPEHCYDPSNDASRVKPYSGVGAPRPWGVSLQLYTLRSGSNWGVGDFGDLRQLIPVLAAKGATAVALNPLFALSSIYPNDASPYLPSSRNFLNPLYIDMLRVPGFRVDQIEREPTLTEALSRLRKNAVVDYSAVATLKAHVLRLLFKKFESERASNPAAEHRSFDRYRQESGFALRQFAAFEANLASRHSADSDAWGWPVWPESMQHGSLATVEKIEAELPDECSYHTWLQWLTSRQLESCQRLARDVGMTIGLCADLPVGNSGPGADTWASSDLYVDGFEIGAPADDYAPDGQAWGAPPLRPLAARQDEYMSFRSMLASAMHWAGGIRVDHVLGLFRQFWVPTSGSASDGLYVHQRYDELLAIVRLESHLHQCMVMGEDLGTVPDIVRSTNAASEILSTRMLYFEKAWDDGGGFVEPADYPSLSVAMIGNHDCPTIRGYWNNCDIELRETLDLYINHDQAASAREERGRDRRRLIELVKTHDLGVNKLNANGALSRELASDLAVALYTTLGTSGVRLVLVQPEDIFGQLAQTNLPGTVDEHVNWRTRYDTSIEQWAIQPALLALAKAMTKPCVAS